MFTIWYTYFAWSEYRDVILEKLRGCRPNANASVGGAGAEVAAPTAPPSTPKGAESQHVDKPFPVVPQRPALPVTPPKSIPGALPQQPEPKRPPPPPFRPQPARDLPDPTPKAVSPAANVSRKSPPALNGAGDEGSQGSGAGAGKAGPKNDFTPEFMKQTDVVKPPPPPPPKGADFPEGTASAIEQPAAKLAGKAARKIQSAEDFLNSEISSSPIFKPSRKSKSPPAKSERATTDKKATSPSGQSSK